jgi:hypothetical protein
MFPFLTKGFAMLSHINGGFQPGHIKYGGRARGTPNRRTQLVQDFCDQHDWQPFEKALLELQQMEAALRDATDTTTRAYQVTRQHYLDLLIAVMPYCYPRQKAVEHSGQIDILHRLQNIKDCSDEELVQLLQDTEDYINRHQAG